MKYIFIKKDTRGAGKLEVVVVDNVSGLSDGSLKAAKLIGVSEAEIEGRDVSLFSDLNDLKKFLGI